MTAFTPTRPWSRRITGFGSAEKAGPWHVTDEARMRTGCGARLTGRLETDRFVTMPTDGPVCFACVKAVT